MKPEQLDHVLRAVDEATGHEHRFLLIGSQAILAHLNPDYFPSDVLFFSRRSTSLCWMDRSNSQKPLQTSSTRTSAMHRSLTELLVTTQMAWKSPLRS